MIEVADVWVDGRGTLVAADAWGACYDLGPAVDPSALAVGLERRIGPLGDDGQRDLAGLLQEAAVRKGVESRFTLPNVLTFLGYAASLAWAGGGPLWLGLFGLVADELDGRLARATGSTTRYGGELDYAVDLTMTGLSALRFGGVYGLALLPIVTGVQAAWRAEGRRPSFGSARAMLTAGAMARQALRRF